MFVWFWKIEVNGEVYCSCGVRGGGVVEVRRG